MDLTGLVERMDRTDRLIQGVAKRLELRALSDGGGRVAWVARGDVQAVIRDRAGRVYIFLRGMAPIEIVSLTIEEVEAQLGLVQGPVPPLE